MYVRYAVMFTKEMQRRLNVLSATLPQKSLRYRLVKRHGLQSMS